MAFLTRLAGLTAILLLLLGSGSPAYADTSLRLMEQKIKAGLLYNFIKHTAWPVAAGANAADAHPPMTVCVYGEDDFEKYLKPMDGRTVNQRNLVLRHVNAVPQTGGCDILFIGAREKGAWKQLQDFLLGKAVLTVSDYDGFAAGGGMIEFHQEDKRIGAVFNLDAFDRAGLQASDSLLKLSGVETLRAGKAAP